MKKSLSSVLIKPAGPDCNMACGYCFYLDRSELWPDNPVHRMSDAVLEEMVRQVLEQGAAEVSFGWQGGEPTLMGVDFFQKAVAFQKRYGQGKVVGNGLQTNGLLIDDEWVTFLAANRFLVGLSLDGPRAIHDHYRLQKGGQPTWERVSRSAARMLEGGVLVNALCVVNDRSVQSPHELYAYYKEAGLNYMQFIPCVEADPSGTGPASFSVDGEDYGRFLIALFDLWMGDFVKGEPTTSIRFFESIFYPYVGMAPPQCTLLPECGVYVVVEHSGDVYACDFFVDPSWKLGNVMEDDLLAMLNSHRQTEFGRQKRRMAGHCGDCRWLPLCCGGCPKDRLQFGAEEDNPLCVAYKMFFEHADPRLRQLAVEWKQKQRRYSLIDSGAYNGVDRNDPCPCGSGKKFKQCCSEYLT